MKKHHLIILSTLVFVILFYNETIGVNLGLLGIFFAVFTFFKTPKSNKTITFFVLLTTTVLSSVAVAWFGDFSSFLALFLSLVLLALKSKSKELKSIFIFPILITNFFTFICRFFNFKEWFPVSKSEGKLQKFVAIIIVPIVLLLIFFAVYTHGSDQFASFFSNFEWNIDIIQFLVLTVFGFFIAFNYWNFHVERFIYKLNHYFKNEFLNEDKQQKASFSFLDLDLERLSGVVSLMALNVMLIIFIISYNYEQFLEIDKLTSDLSAETHERVNAVILSIIMAILIILFYFKSNFNFDDKSKMLKLSAKIWITLNIILVCSAIFKNTEYIVALGMTYKRLGVYAFLLLSIIGLIVTFVKINRQKTNFYLMNHMVWYFYGTILVCSFINWGGIITANNIKRDNFSYNFHFNSINYNEELLLDYATKTGNSELKSQIKERVEAYQKESFLSKYLYYESVKVK